MRAPSTVKLGTPGGQTGITGPPGWNWLQNLPEDGLGDESNEPSEFGELPNSGLDMAVERSCAKKTRLTSSKKHKKMCKRCGALPKQNLHFKNTTVVHKKKCGALLFV
jgi:hypothetical protein